ncbi:MAG: hypothetical protein NWQ41_10080 [Saprospiraceae bacterium]|nr:hypothetical protein [Saprospiraceae bacterium]
MMRIFPSALHLMAGLLLLQSCESDTPPASTSVVPPPVEVTPAQDPARLYGVLFSDVQLSGMFDHDGVFATARPLSDASGITKAYALEKNEPDFDLKGFLNTHFEINPAPMPQPDFSNPAIFFEEALRQWTFSYEESYWLMLGLDKLGRVEEMRTLLDQCAAWINTIGHIPQGARGFESSRSNPPVFALMIELLAKHDGQATYRRYFKALEKEYDFWMRGEMQAYNKKEPVERVVYLPEDDMALNRYWDDSDMPRSEAYAADIRTAKEGNRINSLVYRNIRAASESAWDLSSRWIPVGKPTYEINTADIFPVDLNALLYQTEATLKAMHTQLRNEPKAFEMETRMERRKQAMFKYCWNEEKGYYFDYNFATRQQSTAITAAGLYPLFVELATPQRALPVEAVVRSQLLRPGGLLTTTQNSGKVYDSPNGLPGLHWIAWVGLNHYGMGELAAEIRQNWVQTVQANLETEGRLFGFYDVISRQPGKAGDDAFSFQKRDAFIPTAAVFLLP